MRDEELGVGRFPRREEDAELEGAADLDGGVLAPGTLGKVVGDEFDKGRGVERSLEAAEPGTLAA